MKQLAHLKASTAFCGLTPWLLSYHPLAPVHWATHAYSAAAEAHNMAAIEHDWLECQPCTILAVGPIGEQLGCWRRCPNLLEVGVGNIEGLEASSAWRICLVLPHFEETYFMLALRGLRHELMLDELV